MDKSISSNNFIVLKNFNIFSINGDNYNIKKFYLINNRKNNIFKTNLILTKFKLYLSFNDMVHSKNKKNDEWTFIHYDSE